MTDTPAEDVTNPPPRPKRPRLPSLGEIGDTRADVIRRYWAALDPNHPIAKLDARLRVLEEQAGLPSR